MKIINLNLSMRRKNINIILIDCRFLYEWFKFTNKYYITEWCCDGYNIKRRKGYNDDN